MKRIIEPYTKLKRENYIISFVTFVNVASGFILGLNMFVFSDFFQWDKSQIGVLMSFLIGAGIVGGLSAGILSDYFGRKKIIVLGMSLSGLIFIFLSYVYKVQIALVLGELLYCFFAPFGYITLRALNMEYTSDSTRKTAISLNHMCLNAGFAVAPLIASLIYTTNSENIQYLFFVDGMVTIILTVIIILLLKDKTNNCGIPPKKRETIRAIFRKEKHLIFIFFALFLSWICMSQFEFGIASTVQIIYKTPFWSSIIILVNTLLCILMMPIANSFLNDKDELTILSCVALLYVIGFGVYAFWQTPLILILGTIVWTSGEIASVIILDSYLLSHVEKHLYGRILSLSSTVFYISRACSPLIFSFILVNTTVSVMWLATAFIAGISAFILYSVKKGFLLRGEI